MPEPQLVLIEGFLHLALPRFGGLRLYPGPTYLNKVLTGMNEEECRLMRRYHQAVMESFHEWAQKHWPFCGELVALFLRPKGIDLPLAEADTGLLFWSLVDEEFWALYIPIVLGARRANMTNRGLYESFNDIETYVKGLIPPHPRLKKRREDKLRGSAEQLASVRVISQPLMNSIYTWALQRAAVDPPVAEFLKRHIGVMRQGSLQSYKKPLKRTRLDRCQCCARMFEWQTGRGKGRGGMPPTCGAIECKKRHRSVTKSQYLERLSQG